MEPPDLYKVCKNLRVKRSQILGPNFDRQVKNVLPCLKYLQNLMDNDQASFCTIFNTIATVDKLTPLLPWISDTLIKELAFDKEAAFNVVPNEDAHTKKMPCYQVLIPFASPEALCQARIYDPNIWPVIIDITRRDPERYVQGLQPTNKGPIDAQYFGPRSSTKDKMDNYSWVMSLHMSIRTAMVHRNMKNWQFVSRVDELANVWRVELEQEPGFGAVTRQTTSPLPTDNCKHIKRYIFSFPSRDTR
jgi:hypothetical protein